MSLLSDLQIAVASFVASVATLVEQTGYLVGVVSGPESGTDSTVDVGPRVLKTLSRLELEILASRAFDPQGAWSSGTTYDKLQAVSYGGVAYVSMQDSNTNHQPDSSPTWWMQLVTGLDSIAVSSSAPAGAVANTIWYNTSIAVSLVKYADADSTQWFEI